jgi:hypothetical protein
MKGDDHMFENKLYKGIHATRYIASWRNSGGRWFGYEFRDWLKSLGLNEDEIREIWNMATCGKLELETNAKKSINNVGLSEEDED